MLPEITAMATIYSKTAEGQHEIETRARRIVPRARSALILVDGKRTDEELGKLIQQAETTLMELLEAGLIQAVSTTPPKAALPKEPARDVAPPAVAVAADFAPLRQAAARAVNDLLGPEGDTLALKIERAADANELRAVVERAVAHIASARGGGAAAQFANRFLTPPPG
jgi:hypothetical protein